jgi:hypothetical protein
MASSQGYLEYRFIMEWRLRRQGLRPEIHRCALNDRSGSLFEDAK